MTYFHSNAIRGELDALRSADGERSCAEHLVRRLLERAGLRRLIRDETLAISIGDGHWVSYECDLVLGAETALDEIALRANQSSAMRLKRSVRAGDTCWFRSEGAPSLHFQIVRDGDVLRCRGHVDAAHPWTNPLRHLIYDYLPARGIGTHPAASELLAKMQHIND